MYLLSSPTFPLSNRNAFACGTGVRLSLACIARSLSLARVARRYIPMDQASVHPPHRRTRASITLHCTEQRTPSDSHVHVYNTAQQQSSWYCSPASPNTHDPSAATSVQQPVDSTARRRGLTRRSDARRPTERIARLTTLAQRHTCHQLLAR